MACEWLLPEQAVRGKQAKLKRQKEQQKEKMLYY
jgi:hypothetical protein